MPPYKKYGSARDTAVPEDVSHQQISSYFIGPQAENLSYFENNIRTILKELGIARTNYFGGDGVSSVLACFLDPTRHCVAFRGTG